MKNNIFKAIILCGISGSGKSTYIKNNFSDLKVVSMDEIRAELCGDRRDQSKNQEVAELAKQRFKDTLLSGESVVWDATNLRKEYRKVLIDIAESCGAFSELHVIIRKEAITRLQNLNREFAVPDTVITKQIKQFQFPNESEANIVKYNIEY